MVIQACNVCIFLGQYVDMASVENKEFTVWRITDEMPFESLTDVALLENG